jgi:hypothetical protein
MTQRTTPGATTVLGFEVFTAVRRIMMIFWVLAPCRRVGLF